MMVSFSHLFTLISLFSAVFVAAEDTSSQKSGSVDSKFWSSYSINYNPGWIWGSPYNRVSWLNSYYNNNLNTYAWAYSRYRTNTFLPYRYWFKSEGSQQMRRSIQLQSEPAQPAAGAAEPNNIECKSADGKTTVFNAHECNQAAAKLVNERSSKSVYGKCALSIVGAQGPLVPAGVTTSELQTITRNMLKACAAGGSHSQSKRTPAEASVSDMEKGSFAMFLTAA